jgi:hypothetical protein
MTEVEIVSNWVPDDCWDPCHREATIRYNGELYTAHRTIGEGWPFTVRPVSYDGRSWTVLSFSEFVDRCAP